MMEAEVDGVIASKARPQRPHRAASRPPPHPRHDLAVDIAVVLHVTGKTLGRMAMGRVEALLVDRVYTGDTEGTGVDQVRHRADQAEILSLVEAALRGREPYHRPPGVAEPEQLHLAVEVRGVPEMIFPLRTRLLRR